MTGAKEEKGTHTCDVTALSGLSLVNQYTTTKPYRSVGKKGANRSRHFYTDRNGKAASNNDKARPKQQEEPSWKTTSGLLPPWW